MTGAAPRRELDLRIAPRTVARICCVAVALLCAAHLLMLGLRLGAGREYVWGLARLFNLDGEGNLPSWFSSVLLLACAAALWAIAAAARRTGRDFARHWAVLAAGFTFMSLDESSGIHDLIVGQAIEDRFHPPGWALYFAVPGAVIAVVVVISYLAFLRRLPPRFRGLFLGAGILYVGGAVGMESVGGAVGGAFGWESWGLHLCVLLEETLEMLGLTLFLYSLLRYLGEVLPGLTVGAGGAES